VDGGNGDIALILHPSQCNDIGFEKFFHLAEKSAAVGETKQAEITGVYK
jgi:hypothetical protein